MYFFLPERERERKCSYFTVREKARGDEDGGLLLRWPPTRGGRCVFFVFVFFGVRFSFDKIFCIFFLKEEEEEEFERSRSPTWEPHVVIRSFFNNKKKPSDRLAVDRESQLMGFETVGGKSRRGWRGVVAHLRARRLAVCTENILRLPNGEMFTNECGT